MEIINILGLKIAEKIKISPPAARGLIKLAIKDTIGPFIPLIQISLSNFEAVIKDSLKNRLIKLEVQNVEVLIEELLNVLAENQSLITMANI